MSIWQTNQKTKMKPGKKQITYSKKHKSYISYRNYRNQIKNLSMASIAVANIRDNFTQKNSYIVAKIRFDCSKNI